MQALSEGAVAEYTTSCEKVASFNAAMSTAYILVSEELNTFNRELADFIAAIWATWWPRRLSWDELTSVYWVQINAAECDAKMAGLKVKIAVFRLSRFIFIALLPTCSS